MLKTSKKSALSALSIVGTCLLFSFSATDVEAKKLYKWVDKNGRVSYQDKPPPSSAKILDESELKASVPSTGGSPLNKSPIIVYTATGCTSCDQMVRFLKESDIPHIEKQLQDDREAQQRLITMGKGISVPTFFIGSDVVQTTSEDTLSSALTNAGYIVPKEEATPEDGESLTEASDEDQAG